MKSAPTACVLISLLIALPAAAPGPAIAPAKYPAEYPAEYNVGFMQRLVPDGANPKLDIGIWYPTQATPHPTQISLTTQTVAPDAPPAGQALPLVLFSHGNGGEFSGHADTAWALAHAGFVVASPTHTGDNYLDQSRATDIAGRVRQLAAVMAYMETSWRPAAINPARIGAFGYSAGGLTVLLAAGAHPDLALIGPHCAAHPNFYDCQLIRAHPAPTAFSPPPALPLRAIVAAAPALGYTLTPAALRTVTIPVQLWRADNDQILVAPFYADTVRANLPTPPDFHTVPSAGHFDFLAPCSAALAHIAPIICTSAPAFNRPKFHEQFNQAIVEFFEKNLPPQ